MQKEIVANFSANLVRKLEKVILERFAVQFLWNFGQKIYFSLYPKGVICGSLMSLKMLSSFLSCLKVVGILKLDINS